MFADLPYLFVYGTLRSGASTPWAQFLSGIATRVGAGRASGRLFQLDGYPGMVASPDLSSQVIGDVYRLKNPCRDWPLLDQYEGCGPADPPPHEFERRIVPIRMDDRELHAWVYVYCGDTAGRTPIASGDYLNPYGS